MPLCKLSSDVGRLVLSNSKALLSLSTIDILSNEPLPVLVIVNVPAATLLYPSIKLLNVGAGVISIPKSFKSTSGASTSTVIVPSCLVIFSSDTFESFIFTGILSINTYPSFGLISKTK